MTRVRRLTDMALEDVSVMRALCSIAGDPWKRTDPRLDHDRISLLIWRGSDDVGLATVDHRVIHTPFESHETIGPGDIWPSGWEWGWAR